jgi:hypothetical protein
VDDAIVGAQLAIRPAAASSIHVDVYNYFNNANAAAIRWRRSSRDGGACPTPVVNMGSATDPVAAILNDPLAPADAVVAVVCYAYTPPVANFPLLNGIFQAHTIVKSYAIRPRQSVTLTCVGC